MSKNILNAWKLLFCDAVADPGFANGGKVERHRREYRDAEGADGVCVF